MSAASITAEVEGGQQGSRVQSIRSHVRSNFSRVRLKEI